MLVKNFAHSTTKLQAALKRASAISFSCVSAGVLFGQQPASALVVSVPGYGSFDIQVQDIEFANLNPPASQMPWWGDQAVANLFATTVGSGLGPVLINLGPFFAWDINQGLVSMDSFCIGGPCLGSVGVEGSAFSFLPDGPVGSVDSFAPYPWAIATPLTSTSSVPGPLPLFGAAAAFGFSRKLRGRIKASKISLLTPPSH